MIDKINNQGCYRVMCGRFYVAVDCKTDHVYFFEAPTCNDNDLGFRVVRTKETTR